MITYNEVKVANDNSKRCANDLKRDIRALRAFLEGKRLLEGNIVASIIRYRLASRVARKLSEAYHNQCKTG